MLCSRATIKNNIRVLLKTKQAIFINGKTSFVVKWLRPIKLFSARKSLFHSSQQILRLAGGVEKKITRDKNLKNAARESEKKFHLWSESQPLKLSWCLKLNTRTFSIHILWSWVFISICFVFMMNAYNALANLEVLQRKVSKKCDTHSEMWTVYVCSKMFFVWCPSCWMVWFANFNKRLPINQTCLR